MFIKKNKKYLVLMIPVILAVSVIFHVYAQGDHEKITLAPLVVHAADKNIATTQKDLTYFDKGPMNYYVKQVQDAMYVSKKEREKNPSKKLGVLNRFFREADKLLQSDKSGPEFIVELKDKEKDMILDIDKIMACAVCFFRNGTLRSCEEAENVDVNQRFCDDHNIKLKKEFYTEGPKKGKEKPHIFNISGLNDMSDKLTKIRTRMIADVDRALELSVRADAEEARMMSILTELEKIINEFGKFVKTFTRLTGILEDLDDKVPCSSTQCM